MPNTSRAVRHSAACATITLLGFFSRVQAGPTFTYPATNIGDINSTAIDEASGLVSSQNNANVIWTENDSNNPNTIYAISTAPGTAGKVLGNYTLKDASGNNVANVDWESIQIGPGPVAGVSYIYVATIGDAKTGGTVVYRIPEPTVYAGKQAGAPVTTNLVGTASQKVTTGASDGEAMLVDPTNGDIYLANKNSFSGFYKLTQAQFGSSSSAVTAPLVYTTTAGKLNDASISADGSQILLRTQNSPAFYYTRAPGQTIASALAGTPTLVQINEKNVEPDAEAIAFDAAGKNFYTTSEGKNQPLYLYTRTSNDAPVAPTTLLAAGSSWHYLSGGAAPASGWQGKTFNAAGWSTGTANFGYGLTTDPVQTTITKGAASYFTTTFTVTDAASLKELTLKLLYNDGAAVYLNGTEIERINLAAGATNSTFAESALDPSVQDTWTDFAINPALLVNGTNTLAVEIHSASAGDTDLRFDAQIVGTTVPEPAMAALAGIFGLGLLSRRPRRTNA